MLKYLIIATTFLAITLGVLLMRAPDDTNLYNTAVFVSAPQNVETPSIPNNQPIMVEPSSISPIASVRRPAPRIRNINAQVAIAGPATIPNTINSQDDLLRTITSGAFAGMANVTPTQPTLDAATGTPTPPDALQAMIIQSLRDGTGSRPSATFTPPKPIQRSAALLQVLQPTTYVVKPGDSLGTIAAQFYGSKENYYRIYEANKSRLSSPDSIRVGQKLTIPKT